MPFVVERRGRSYGHVHRVDEWGICSRRGRFRRRMPRIAVRNELVPIAAFSSSVPWQGVRLVSWDAKRKAGLGDVLPRSLHPV